MSARQDLISELCLSMFQFEGLQVDCKCIDVEIALVKYLRP